MKTRFFVALLFVALPLIAFGQTLGTRTVTIKIDGPAVIGFFPPVKQLGDDNPDDAVIEITGKLSDALDEANDCLKKSGITANKFGNRLNVCDQGKRPAGPDRIAEIVGKSGWSVFLQARRDCAGHLR